MIASGARRALETTLGEAVRFDVPMSRHTSLRVGGPVDAFARPASRAQLSTLLGICREHRLDHHVVGSGFNTVVREGGLAGVALQLSRLRRLEERPGAAVRAEAGVSHSQITRFCGERGLGGLEFGAGIPGTLGGWLAMNAGIPGREIGDRLRELEVMSPTGRRIRHLARCELHLVYRALRGLAPGSVVLSALLGVVPSSAARVRAEVEHLLAQRARTQPLNVPSCGSVFKNPPRDHAGRLIEAAGLKGLRIGGAQISPLHANFITNLGGATADDVLALIEHTRKVVEDECGLRLETEVRIIGRRK